MLTLKPPESRPVTIESPLTPMSPSPIRLSIAKDGRKTVAYIEIPPLAPTECAKYEAVSDRSLPQDFNYSLPLSGHVIIGEYRDNDTLWYYVENAAGIAHRVSALLCLFVPVIRGLFEFTPRY
jgi:hypothetical protein